MYVDKGQHLIVCIISVIREKKTKKQMLLKKIFVTLRLVL